MGIPFFFSLANRIKSEVLLLRPKGHELLSLVQLTCSSHHTTSTTELLTVTYQDMFVLHVNLERYRED